MIGFRRGRSEDWRYEGRGGGEDIALPLCSHDCRNKLRDGGGLNGCSGSLVKKYESDFLDTKMRVETDHQSRSLGYVVCCNRGNPPMRRKISKKHPTYLPCIPSTSQPYPQNLSATFAVVKPVSHPYTLFQAPTPTTSQPQDHGNAASARGVLRGTRMNAWVADMGIVLIVGAMLLSETD